MGYHVAAIPKGHLGDSSKLLEEVMELRDAESQGVRIMALAECADILGALAAYLDKHFPEFGIDDLQDMQEVTARAFSTGRR